MTEEYWSWWYLTWSFGWAFIMLSTHQGKCQADSDFYHLLFLLSHWTGPCGYQCPVSTFLLAAYVCIKSHPLLIFTWSNSWFSYMHSLGGERSTAESASQFSLKGVKCTLWSIDPKNPEEIFWWAKELKGVRVKKGSLWLWKREK